MKKCGPKVYAPGNPIIQNMRNGLIQLLTPVTDGSAKEHEMPKFRNMIEKIETNSKSIWVADRAYMDNRWWEKQKRKGYYIISRAKSNRSVMCCGDCQFDKDDPVNAGVVRDSLGGLRQKYLIFAGKRNEAYKGTEHLNDFRAAVNMPESRPARGRSDCRSRENS